MRIASLAPSCTEMLFELGSQNDIVCSTIFCDYPQEAKLLPKVGSWVNSDMELLKSLAPDLVLTSSSAQSRLTSLLRSQGMNAVNISPGRLYEVVESYNHLGQLIGREREAARIAGGLYKKIMSYHLKTALGRPLRVYCEEWSNPPMAAGNWVPDIVGLAGGLPGIAEAGTSSRTFEFSELAKFDPEVIIMHICGYGDRVEPLKVKDRAGWAELSAVKSGRVHVFHDSLLNRPTSRLFTGLEKISELLAGYQQNLGAQI